MAKYDINDPYDVATMNAVFEGYSADELNKYIDIAKEKKFSFGEVGQLTTASKKAVLSKYLS